MSASSPSSSFVSERAMVTCRLCQITLRKKNYKSHLKKRHPKANIDDLSGKDQLKLSNMFLLGESTRDKNEKEVESMEVIDNLQDYDTVGDGDSDNDLVFHEEEKLPEANTNKRKRFESGDSAFSDNIGEIKQDSKLDEILKEFCSSGDCKTAENGFI